MATRYQIKAAVVCHKGNHRILNEDNFFFDRFILEEKHEGLSEYVKMEEDITKTPQLFGVFDGMGGHKNGQRASYLAAQKTSQLFEQKKISEGKIVHLLNSICLESNQEICKEMKLEKARMGTTASMLYFYKKQAWVCNVGDSPIYRLRDGVLEEIFEEHTERKMREQLSGKESVKGKKFPLLQHIGIFPDEMLIRPYINSFKIKKGDIYLITSDGLTDMVEQEMISNIMKSDSTVEDKIMSLRELALSNGGKDNITTILIYVDEHPKREFKLFCRK